MIDSWSITAIDLLRVVKLISDIFLSLIIIYPDVVSTNLIKVLIMVVFPEAVSPTMQTLSPF
jgi:hypothetical protein